MRSLELRVWNVAALIAAACFCACLVSCAVDLPPLTLGTLDVPAYSAGHVTLQLGGVETDTSTLDGRDLHLLQRLRPYRGACPCASRPLIRRLLRGSDKAARALGR